MDNVGSFYGSSQDGMFRFQTGDADANQLIFSVPKLGGANTSVLGLVGGDVG